MTIRRLTLALLCLYALLTAYTIIGGPLGIAPGRYFTPLVTLAGFSFALLHAGQREGWGRALRLLALVVGVMRIGDWGLRIDYRPLTILDRRWTIEN